MDTFLPGLAGRQDVFNNPVFGQFSCRFWLAWRKANDVLLGQQMKLVATGATMLVLKDTGHWLMEERPKETMDALLKFL